MDVAANADVFLYCLLNEHDRCCWSLSFILFLTGRLQWRWICDEKQESPFLSAGAAMQHCSLRLPENAGRLHAGTTQAGEECLFQNVLDISAPYMKRYSTQAEDL